jgi:hypothetical protein
VLATATRRSTSSSVLGLHADAASAQRLAADRQTAAPCLDEAAEVWSGLLQPFRHKGKANYLSATQPDKFFDRWRSPCRRNRRPSC